MYKKIMMYYMCMFILLSCKNDSSVKHSRVYYPSGQLKSEATVESNSKSEFLTSYYENGNIESTIHFRDSFLHGLATYYFPNGNVKKIGNFADNNEDSTWVTYYENGSYQYIINFINGNRFGNFFYFSSNGKLSVYNFIAKDGYITYSRKYDSSTGNITKEFGFPMNVLYDSILSKDNSQKLFIVIGLLKNCNFELIVSDISSSVPIVLEKINESSKLLVNGIYGKQYVLSRKIEHSGYHKWLINARMIDKVFGSNLAFCDTLRFVVR